MWERTEDQGAPFQMRIVVSDEANILTTQTRTLSLSLVGAGELKTKPRMVRDEGAQLTAGIAGRAEHPDGKFMHAE